LIVVEIKYSDIDQSTARMIPEGLKAAESLVQLVEDQVNNEQHPLQNVEIYFGDDLVSFTPQEYCHFAKESLERVILERAIVAMNMASLAPGPGSSAHGG
jgi:hypothetical protein